MILRTYIVTLILVVVKLQIKPINIEIDLNSDDQSALEAKFY